MNIKEFYIKLKNLFKNDKYPNKIKLDILGISNSKFGDNSMFVIILGEDEGDRKIPVVVNYYEAQSIAIEIENKRPGVPLVYDVLKNIINIRKIKFNELLISEFKNEILTTHLVGKKDKVEIRTADGIAMSVRMKYPIYIYEDVLKKVDDVVKKYYDIKDGNKLIDDNKNKVKGFTIDELNELLTKAISEEEYEKASEIRDEIIKKKKDHLN